MNIVFSDVDGTLVGDDHHPIAQSADAIRTACEHVTFCLVSARSPEGLYPIQEQLGFSGPLACYSGAYVLDHEGTELFSTTIPTSDAVLIKEYVSAEFPTMTVGTYGFHTWIADDANDPRIRNEEKLVQTTATTCKDLMSAFGTRGVHKLLLMGEPDQIRVAQKTLAARYPSLNVVRSSSILCEVMARNASKSNAVRIVCERYATSPERAVAFGDGPNDIDMLQAVGTSYAMANAEKSVMDAATHVLPWTNQQSGVARQLEKLMAQ
ncbi:MAG: HAD family hydrolase [Atopobiaceae bacterium]|nr:HAD family hydrolase [Atopobiaceae bacterium]